jgi:hypothetical protein
MNSFVTSILIFSALACGLIVNAMTGDGFKIAVQNINNLNPQHMLPIVLVNKPKRTLSISMSFPHGFKLPTQSNEYILGVNVTSLIPNNTSKLRFAGVTYNHTLEFDHLFLTGVRVSTDVVLDKAANKHYYDGEGQTLVTTKSALLSEAKNSNDPLLHKKYPPYVPADGLFDMGKSFQIVSRYYGPTQKVTVKKITCFFFII